MVAVLRKMFGLCVGKQDEVLPWGWMYWRSMHNSQCEQKAMHSTEEASKYRWWKCQKPQLNISQKELTSLLQTTSRFNIKSMVKFYSKEGRSRRHKYPARSLDLQHNLVITSHFQTWKAIKFYCTFNNFSEFVVRYKLKDNNPLLILTYSTNKLYHLLLNSSKHLQRIKLSKFNDLQDYAGFSLYHYHMHNIS